MVPTPPVVGLPIGLGSLVGVLSSVTLALIAVIAAIAGNDAQAVGPAAGSLLSALALMGGRYAQAVAQIRAAAASVAAPAVAELPAAVPAAALDELDMDLAAFAAGDNGPVDEEI